jgi:hypothetical protein
MRYLLIYCKYLHKLWCFILLSLLKIKTKREAQIIYQNRKEYQKVSLEIFSES